MSEGTIDREAVAADFAANMSGVLEQEKIDQAVGALVASTTSHSANGSVASMLFYLRFSIGIKGGKTFTGNAGGVSSPGGGALWGNVYTNDLEALYAKTVSFQFNATPVYTNLNFFDRHSNLLGHFQSGSLSTVLGTGGGSGSWK